MVVVVVAAAVEAEAAAAALAAALEFVAKECRYVADADGGGLCCGGVCGDGDDVDSKATPDTADDFDAAPSGVPAAVVATLRDF